MSPREDEKTRVDRELIEFLNELRVALPGVQVLFAFLLIVPFNVRFADLGATDEKVYLAAVISTALSSVLLIAPAAQHRLRFRRVDKEHLLRVGTRLAVVALALLVVGVAASVHVVTRLIYGGTVAAVLAGVITAAAVALWFVLPLTYPPSPHEDDERRSERPTARS